MTTLNLTKNALTVLQARYLLGDETPEKLFRRVARAVAEAEAPEERVAWEETFYEMMASTKFMPNSPTLFNAGTGKGTLSACFVIPVEDTMESIMQAATTSAMIQKYGGGIGYAFSKLRPAGSAISTTQGRACGAVAVPQDDELPVRHDHPGGQATRRQHGDTARLPPGDSGLHPHEGR